MVARRRTQAFKQAPWRAQIRFTGRTLVWLIVVLLVGGLYLAVSARVARAGQEVLSLDRQRAELQRENAELTASLAEITTPQRLLERALEMGFEPVDPGDIQYIVVPGYRPPSPFVAPNPPAHTNQGQGSLSPAYTETLGSWLMRWLSWDTGANP
jgi:cell division protein FtsL